MIDRDPSRFEVAVLRPHRQLARESEGDDWPVVRVSGRPS